MDQKTRENKVKNIKDKSLKLKTKYEKYLEKNPNDNKCKEALKRIDNSLKVLEKIESDRIEKKKLEEIDEMKKIYKETILSLKSTDRFNDETFDNLALAFILFSEKDIINRFKKSSTKNDIHDILNSAWYGGDEVDFERDLSNNPLVQSVKNDKFITLFYGDDSVFEIDIDKNKIISFYYPRKIEYLNTNEIINNFKKSYSEDIIKIADRELGYYLLSEPPKNIQRKEI